MSGGGIYPTRAHPENETTKKGGRGRAGARPRNLTRGGRACASVDTAFAGIAERRAGARNPAARRERGNAALAAKEEAAQLASVSRHARMEPSCASALALPLDAQTKIPRVRACAHGGGDDERRDDVEGVEGQTVQVNVWLLGCGLNGARRSAARAGRRASLPQAPHSTARAAAKEGRGTRPGSRGP